MLIGTRICLAPVMAADAPHFFNWRNTLDLERRNGVFRPLDEGAFGEWFAALSKDPSRVMFALRLNLDMRLIGYVGLSRIAPVERMAEVGILIGQEGDRNLGYGQEAMALIRDYAWSELNLQRLSLNVFSDNLNAIAAYQKSGFEIEGVQRRAVYVEGRFKDLVLMGLLREP